jgi:hypothetical protein
MAHEGFHEPYELLTPEVREAHRILQSTMEELEAVDWYNQRACASENAEAKAVLEHNRDEEIEHACMGLEWLRRNNPVWDTMLRRFLFTDGSLTAIEEKEMPVEAAETDNHPVSGLGIGKIT